MSLSSWSRATAAAVFSGAFVWSTTVLSQAFQNEVSTLAAPSTFMYQPHRARALRGHVAQDDVEARRWSAEQLRLAGEDLFLAQFTKLDGAGRPGATGNPSPTRRPLGTGPAFVRTAGPDANACVSCHNRPNVGGAGDFSANVFAGLGARHPVFLSVDSAFSAERDSPELHGAGAVELLAREMTMTLHRTRSAAIEQARARGHTVRLPLTAKRVSFGHISALPDGSLQLHEIKGLDRDLVVRPWGQKGLVTSLRTFTINAMNLHHGMQANERYGFHLTGSEDFDRDGVADELTEGDITALVVFQASLPVPGRVLPRTSSRQERVRHGEQVFRQSMCASCHIPELPLDATVFSEPSPYNLEGTLRVKDVTRVFEFDLLKDTQAPRLRRDKDGKVWVRLFSDLKRHRISDEEKPHFGNETLVEGLTTIDEFITKRLWAVGSTAPYGHRGDITTVREAILHHGGEARESRLEFEAISPDDQEAVIQFLQTLQIVPTGSPLVVLEPQALKLPYRSK